MSDSKHTFTPSVGWLPRRDKEWLQSEVFGDPSVILLFLFPGGQLSAEPFDVLSHVLDNATLFLELFHGGPDAVRRYVDEEYSDAFSEHDRDECVERLCELNRLYLQSDLVEETCDNRDGPPEMPTLVPLPESLLTNIINTSSVVIWDEGSKGLKQLPSSLAPQFFWGEGMNARARDIASTIYQVRASFCMLNVGWLARLWSVKQTRPYELHDELFKFDEDEDEDDSEEADHEGDHLMEMAGLRQRKSSSESKRAQTRGGKGTATENRGLSRSEERMLENYTLKEDYGPLRQAMVLILAGLALLGVLPVAMRVVARHTGHLPSPDMPVEVLIASQHPPLQTTSLNVHWMAPFLNFGGYASEATAFVFALVGSHHEPLVGHLSINQHGDSISYEYIESLSKMEKDVLSNLTHEASNINWQRLVSICHSEPGAWHPSLYPTSRCPPAGSPYNVGRTMFETDRLPTGWPDRMMKMDELWVPTQFARNIFLEAGVTKPVRVVHEPVDTDRFNPEKTEALNIETFSHSWFPDADESKIEKSQRDKIPKDAFIILSVFKWEQRKGWDVLLKAYFAEFSIDDDVVLLIRTSSYHDDDNFDAKINNFVSDVLDIGADERKHLPRIRFVVPLPPVMLPQLYKSSQVFVLPSRGEGWGRPHVEAMSMSLPVVATFWSGTTEYMTKENSYPLQIDGLESIEEGPFKGHQWAKPSVAHLQSLLKEIRSDPLTAIARGEKARQDMVDKYSPAALAEQVVAELVRIEIEHF